MLVGVYASLERIRPAMLQHSGFSFLDLTIHPTTILNHQVVFSF